MIIIARFTAIIHGAACLISLRLLQRQSHRKSPFAKKYVGAQTQIQIDTIK